MNKIKKYYKLNLSKIKFNVQSSAVNCKMEKLLLLYVFLYTLKEHQKYLTGIVRKINFAQSIKILFSFYQHCKRQSESLDIVILAFLSETFDVPSGCCSTNISQWRIQNFLHFSANVFDFGDIWNCVWGAFSS